ncbi:MAG: ABC transporter ATP-binding protein [Selenomonadaceae bacterium]|nr:ABC transporter ATP-binding protein [Selenomonadaceae bacterium]
MLKFVLRYLGDFKLKFFMILLCAVVTAAADLLMPYLSAKFIDEVLSSREIGRLYFFVGGLFALNVISLAANWFYVIFSTKLRARITNKLIADVTAKIWRARLQFQTDMIYLAKRVEKDSDDLIAFVLGSAIDVAIQAVLLVMAIFFLLSVGGKWLIIFAITAAFHGMIYFALKKKLFELSTAVRETESKYFESLSDNFFYVFRIKLHSLQEEFSSTFNRAFEKFFSAGLSESKLRFWFSYGNANTAKIFTVLIFLLGGLDVLDGTLTVGNFVALNGYFTFAMHGVSYFMTLGQGRQNALAAYVRIMEIKNFPVEVNGTKILSRINSIELANVSFSFGEQKILTNFSRHFVRGKIYCIVGKNGAGKSTLMNLICGMIRPVSGEIFFDGIELAEVDMIHARRNLIAVVEQKDFLKNDKLSGGERRKISIVTAFAKSADVLIMDEPDNNLDAAAVDALTKKILADKANRITLIISHDERLIDVADEVLTLTELICSLTN